MYFSCIISIVYAGGLSTKSNKCGNKVISYVAPHGGKEKNRIQFNLVQEQFNLKVPKSKDSCQTKK